MGAAAMSGSWADLLSAGRLPRFVLICLAVWLNAATARLTGAAAGSAMAAAVANLAGFANGFTIEAARATGVWVFLAALPVAALACLSAWQMAVSRDARAAKCS